MILNAKTGELQDVSSSGESMRDMLSSVLGSNINSLLQQVGQPNLAVSVIAEKGWQTRTCLRDITGVELTVTKVTDNQVWVSYHGGEPGNRLAGVAILERASGWIIKQVLTTELEHTFAGKTIGIRSTQIMAQVADAQETHVPRLRSDWANRWTPLSGGELPDKIVSVSDADKMFGQPHATLEQDEDTLKLSLRPQVSHPARTGVVKISDPVLFDARGEKLTPPMQLGRAYTYGGDEEDALTEATLHFTALGDLTQIARQTASLQATVAWYPDESFIIRLTPDKHQQAHYQKKGVNIHFGPSEDADVYELTFEGKATDRVSPRLADGQPFDIQFRAYPAAPQWLTAEESLVRYRASARPEAHRMLIRTDRAPAYIDLVVSRSADVAASSRQLTFRTADARRMGPAVKPEAQYLYEGTRQPAPLHALKPTGLDRGQVLLSMLQAQIEACTASLTPSAEEAGTPLIFAAITDNDSFAQPAMLQLQTEDGVRQFFYDLGERTVDLSCTSSAMWQPAELILDEQSPWVVATEDLLNKHHFSTVGELLAHYRILDAKGRVLSLQTVSEGVALTPSTALDAVIFPDNTLRVAGVPTTIEVIGHDDKPIERQFKVTFPRLAEVGAQ